jgi:hypothetical protein
MTNFLTEHTIGKIIKSIIDLNIESENKNFLFFDEPIIEDDYIINRVNTHSSYQSEEILPISWYSLKGTTLIKIYQKLKERKIYVTKNINGLTYKIKIDELSKYRFPV